MTSQQEQNKTAGCAEQSLRQEQTASNSQEETLGTLPNSENEEATPLPGKKEILAKKQALENVAAQLKQDFIGLDHIIDEVISLLSPWFIFPESQMRPTIINLWGMTGTGKSAMVKRLVELLEYNRQYVYFDLGEYNGDSSSCLKSTFSYDLSYFHQKEVIICLDEFQFARTINEGNEEIPGENLRIIWELLDSGKFYHAFHINSYYTKRAMKLSRMLSRCHDKGVELHNGKITTNLSAFQEILGNFQFGWEDGESNDETTKKKSEDYFLSKSFLTGLGTLSGNLFDSDQDMKETIKELSLSGIRQLLMLCIDQETSMTEMDLSKSLIFNIGNLDEAFYMSHNMNPDISADDFYEEANKINISHIKTALQSRFRNEQIARMGNNHLLYPAFNEKNYGLFIRKELGRIQTYLQERFQLTLRFEQSIHELVYQEGVFPTQGARPVLTTIKNLIESHIGTIVCYWIENDLDIAYVQWSIENDGYVVSYCDEHGETLDKLQIPLRLKVNQLRQSKNDDTQAHTAVHESGHAVLASMTLRIVPVTVVTQTASSNAVGFCQVNLPEDVRTFDILKKDIMISLGGYLAEKMIFGSEHLSTGSYKDLRHATQQANAAVREFGMLGLPMSISVKSVETNSLFFYEEEHGQMAQRLLQQCMEEAEQLLHQNKRFLLELSKYLTVHSRINEEQIEAMALQYAKADWLHTEGFIQKQEYFNFKQKLQDVLDQFVEEHPEESSPTPPSDLGYPTAKGSETPSQASLRHFSPK